MKRFVSRLKGNAFALLCTLAVFAVVYGCSKMPNEPALADNTPVFVKPVQTPQPTDVPCDTCPKPPR